MSFLINTSLLLLWQSAEPTPQSLPDVFFRIQTRIRQALPGLFLGVLVFLIFLLVAWIGARIIAYAAPRVKADTGVVLLLSRLYFYSIIIFGIVTALSTTGLNVNALVAGLGLTGFALGFALKDVLSNLLSGIMLLIYRPFNIGDQIKMGTYEGTITTIRMRDTVARSFDGRDIIIPNAKLITEVVINNKASKFINESLVIFIPANANTKEACELLLKEMEKHPALTGRVEPPIRLKQLDQDTVQLEGRFWFDPHAESKDKIKTEIVQSVKTIFKHAGIEMKDTPDKEIEAEQRGEEVVEEWEA